MLAQGRNDDINEVVMPKTLKHSLSSKYLEAARLLSPKKKRKRVVAYVESYDDIAFWRDILNNFENDKRYFEVMLPAGSRNLVHGKKSVLMQSLQSEQLGENLIACVDSDYDFLLQGASDSSKQVNSSPYVLQTYCYAIENYWCYADSLHDVCVKATLNDHQIFDFKQFLTDYSTIVYPLFMWNVYFYRRCDWSTFPMKRLHENTALGNISIKNPRQVLDNLQHKVDRELEYWTSRFPELVDEVEKEKKKVEELGLTPDNTYLYMQGHHIMDAVVLRVLIPVCAQLRKEQEDMIRRKSVHVQQFDNELTSYERSAMPVEVVIRQNKAYTSLFCYRWILEDIYNIFP
jgi:hypothetical protein